MNRIAPITASLLLALLAGAAWSKLPPLSPEAQAKAEEAKAKAAHADKVAAYQLCEAMDRVAAGWFAAAKKAGRTVAPPVSTPPCVDPGPFASAAAPAAKP